MDYCKLFLLFSFTIINVAIGSVPELPPNTFLFCLKPELEPLEISLNRGRLSVGLAELDDFFKSHDVIKIEPWIKSATEIDRDGDIYLNRIYRSYIDENSLGRTDQSIASIQDFPFILYAEPEYIRKLYTYPNDYNPNSQCSIAAVKADLAWDYWDIESGEIPGDENILLASVDTGVDYTHPDLIENIWVNQGEILPEIFEYGIDSDNNGVISASEISSFMSIQGSSGDLNNDGISNFRDALLEGSPFIDNLDNDGNGYTDDIIGWDASGEWGASDNDPFPKTGVLNGSEWAHGTHVAGILAATTNNGLGMASTMFNGSIISVKASQDGPDSNEPNINNGYEGIYYAARAGYHAGKHTIINNSWGSASEGNGIIDGTDKSGQAIINIAFNDYGAIIVAAAGNGVEDAHQEEYADHYPASYENVVSICAISCNGNWGNWATYHTTVDLAAPGESIYSAIIGGGYESWDGSSMASPNAASVMGLVWSYYPEWSNEDVVEQVKLAADPFIYERNPDYIDCNGESTDGYCLGAGMVDAHKAIGRGFSPNIQPGPFMFTEIIGDSDGIINPGETGYLTISLKNALGWADAENIEAELSTYNSGVIIYDGSAVYGDINSGDSLLNVSQPYKITFSPDIELIDIDFQLQITGSSTEYNYNQTLQYSTISVSINQAGFPISNLEFKPNSSPLVIDWDNDGNNEIIVGDKSGFIRIFNTNGLQIEHEIFPYDTGGEIWGSVAAADLDLDGILDFVIPSKSDSIYIFDRIGIKTIRNTDKYLIGTPAIGNLDGDDELEVVFTGYSSGNNLFVINHDGSDVSGFPFELDEKVKAGVSLADFNGNGKDDIVLGTDVGNVYLIYDNGEIAPGFPYHTDDKIQSAPSIIDINGEKVIFIGSNDDYLYAIKSDGSLQFRILTGDKVQISPSFLTYNDGIVIFFGSKDGLIYAVDSDGNPFSDNWPVNTNRPISGSVVFADLDCDNDPEIIAVNDAGSIFAFNIDGSFHKHFPIINDIGFSSSPIVTDIDSDGDLETLVGSNGNLVVIDIKSFGSDTSFWNMYRGNNRRTGYLDPISIGGYIAQCPENLEIINNSLPTEFIMSPLYPNPFNPVTTISYSIPQAGPVSIKVYNLVGRELETLINKKQNPGDYLFIWNASSYPSGIYFIRLESNNFNETRKVLLIK